MISIPQLGSERQDLTSRFMALAQPVKQRVFKHFKSLVSLVGHQPAKPRRTTSSDLALMSKFYDIG